MDFQTIVVFILIAISTGWFIWNYIFKKKQCGGCGNCDSNKTKKPTSLDH